MQDDGTALAAEITGTVSDSDVTFTIPALSTATIGGVPVDGDSRGRVPDPPHPSRHGRRRPGG